MTTQLEASNDIFAMFLEGWEANTPAITSYVPKVEWPGTKIKGHHNRTEAWARATLTHTISSHKTMGSNSLRERLGFFTLQIFSPALRKPDMRTCYKLGEVFRLAMEGNKTVNHCVQMRDCVLHEVPPSGGWLQLNAVVDFSWDDRRIS